MSCSIRTPQRQTLAAYKELDKDDQQIQTADDLQNSPAPSEITPLITLSGIRLRNGGLQAPLFLLTFQYAPAPPDNDHDDDNFIQDDVVHAAAISRLDKTACECSALPASLPAFLIDV